MVTRTTALSSVPCNIITTTFISMFTCVTLFLIIISESVERNVLISTSGFRDIIDPAVRVWCIRYAFLLLLLLLNLISKPFTAEQHIQDSRHSSSVRLTGMGVGVKQQQQQQQVRVVWV